MKMNRFVKTVTPSEIYTEYLKSLNGLLRLTDRELEILAKIIELNPKVSDDNEFENVVSLQVRRRIMYLTKVNKANLSKHITNFVNRKYLIRDNITKCVKINKALIPVITDGKIIINMTINIEDGNNNNTSK